MPNYTMTEMSFTGDPERIKELREMIRTDDAVIDFNKIIHMPESLNMEEGTATDRGLSAILTAINPGTPDYGEKKVSIKTFTSLVKKVRKACGPFNTEDTIRVNAPETINKKNIKNGQIYLNNIKKYGYPTWYGWCDDNWGTKWNALETCESDDNTIWFQTANGVAIPICEALSEKFPDVTIKLRWADEDTSYGTGEAEFSNQNSTMTEYEGESKDAYELYAELWDVCLEDVGFIYDEEKGTYIYHCH